MHSALSFLFAENAHGDMTIIPCVDGVSLSEMITEFEDRSGYTDPAGGYGGLIPDFFNYGPLQSYFLGEEDHGEGDRSGEIYLLACDCGEVGCWPLMARVTQSDAAVEWGDFRQPHRPNRDYSSLGRFRFERSQYLAAVEGLRGAWR